MMLDPNNDDRLRDYNEEQKRIAAERRMQDAATFWFWIAVICLVLTAVGFIQDCEWVVNR